MISISGNRQQKSNASYLALISGVVGMNFSGLKFYCLMNNQCCKTSRFDLSKNAKKPQILWLRAHSVIMIHRIVKIVARIPSYREYEKSVKLKVSEPFFHNMQIKFRFGSPKPF